MDWGGKLVGGAVGLLLAGPVGAALGVLAGHLVDDKLTSASSRKRPEQRPTDRRTQGSRPASAANSAGAARTASPRPTKPEVDRPSKIYHVEDTDPFAVPAEGPEVEGGAESDEGPSVENPEAVAAQFFQTTFEVMGNVAKCDGRVSESDIRAARAVMKDFALDEAQVARAIANFNVGKQSNYDVERAVMALRRICAGRPDLLRTFLEIQVRAAIGGSDLQGASRPLLNRIAAMLGVGGLEFAQLETLLRIRYRARGNRGDAADWNRPADDTPDEADTPGAPGGSAGAAGTAGAGSGKGNGAGAGHAGARAGKQRSGAGERGSAATRSRMSLQEAYQVLGVLPGARMPEITKAYRRQLSRHHPDKLKANGLPESMLAFAQQQTLMVIEAFNLIRDSRGEKS